MVSTRRQSLSEMKISETQESSLPASKTSGTTSKAKKEEPESDVGSKRNIDQAQDHAADTDVGPPKKKGKAKSDYEDLRKEDSPVKQAFHTGTIERGYIYFFYRPKIDLEEAHSLDDVQRFHMLLVPRPPEFSVHYGGMSGTGENDQMNLISEGADAVPAAATTSESSKSFRLISIGKKSFPNPDVSGGGKGGRRKEIFWATINTTGNDLSKLQEGLGTKTYETKTRGTRHQASARLAARGAYAIVNTQGKAPSSRETHLGYHLSHPATQDLGEVQELLGIHSASSFVVQVKNPLAPDTGSTRSGLPSSRRADYPRDIMENVFGQGGGKGRESFGLRFAPVERKEMLDYEGVELLFIAARSGEEGLEISLGEGRGQALTEAENHDSRITINDVLKELAMDANKIPAAPLVGTWI